MNDPVYMTDGSSVYYGSRPVDGHLVLGLAGTGRIALLNDPNIAQ